MASTCAIAAKIGWGAKGTRPCADTARAESGTGWLLVRGGGEGLVLLVLEVLSECDLAGMAPHDVAEAFGGGVEVVAGGVQGGVTEQGLQLDDVGAGLERRGGEGVAQAWTSAPLGTCARIPARL